MRMINGKRDCERGRRILKCDVEEEGARKIEKEKEVYRSVW